ncbi:L-asparaginase-like Protein [Tribolium castaneum]|uniref:asparaginase n=1 Tax=Tribolium castaneum TaxID=7070 RepID=D6WPV5_TRICA|nr:L-asparaginase-like Protein [Tribolium castaneum]
MPSQNEKLYKKCRLSVPPEDDFGLTNNTMACTIANIVNRERVKFRTEGVLERISRRRSGETRGVLLYAHALLIFRRQDEFQHLRQESKSFANKLTKIDSRQDAHLDLTGKLELFLQPFDGLVIRSYGSGNVPSDQPELIQVLKNAIDRGLLIINTTQCLEGAVSGIYQTGKILEDIGVISGYDMTPEAALTKLSVVLAYPHLSHQERIQMMKSNIRGELTSNHSYSVT